MGQTWVVSLWAFCTEYYLWLCDRLKLRWWFWQNHQSSFSKRFAAQNCLSDPCVKGSFFPFFSSSSSDHAVFGVHRAVLCVFCCRVPALQRLQYVCHRGAAWFQQTGIAYIAAWHLVQLELCLPDPSIKWTLPPVRCSVCVCTPGSKRGWYPSFFRGVGVVLLRWVFAIC